MKLEKVLDNLNSFEKNSFLKIIDSILSNSPRNIKEIMKILSDSSLDLKNADSINISKVFNLIEEEFTLYIKEQFEVSTSQLDILADIISRDGNCILKYDWFDFLYQKELKQLTGKISEFKKELENGTNNLDPSRKRDYNIYRSCVHTAFYNDLKNNQECKITLDEQSILTTLALEIGLSQEEIKLLKYMVLPVEKLDIETILDDLKNIGIIFYSKKNMTVYVADEIVRIIRKARGKEVADKFYRRVLRLLREPQVNMICKKHNINWHLNTEQKIKTIIKEGISFRDILTSDIFKEEVKKSEKKSFLNELCDKGLNITPILKGSTLEEKLDNLIKFFDESERDEKVGISVDGYEKLLMDLGTKISKTNKLLKEEFEIQNDNVLISSLLLDYNIKPRDVLEVIPSEDIEKFCHDMNIKTRGELILNILDAYTDSENLFLENYEHIAFRNLNALKENNINIKESDLGIKFEELTKSIFIKLGFNVDETLRKKINTSKNKMDIVINLDNNELILVECKTNKDSGYNKFSSVSRQLKSYIDLAKSNEFKVLKVLLVAPEFSDTFIKDCGLDYELNLSLISAASLVRILEGFKNSKLKQLPYNLLMRDVLINEDIVLKAIDR